MKMNSSKQMLESLLRTAQMSQTGIRSALDTAMGPALRQALESQLQEFDAIETEAHHIASQRGWELQEPEPGMRFMADMVTRVRLAWRSTDSRIAGMMIQGNTRGMIEGLTMTHRTDNPDREVHTLSRRLLDCERANIRQMQSFL